MSELSGVLHEGVYASPKNKSVADGKENINVLNLQLRNADK